MTRVRQITTWSRTICISMLPCINQSMHVVRSLIPNPRSLGMRLAVLASLQRLIAVHITPGSCELFLPWSCAGPPRVDSNHEHLSRTTVSKTLFSLQSLVSFSLVQLQPYNHSYVFSFSLVQLVQLQPKKKPERPYMLICVVKLQSQLQQLSGQLSCS